MSQELEISVVAGQGSASGPELEAYLTTMVLDSVTSHHSRRAYRTGLVFFFAWFRQSCSPQVFSKGMVAEYRTQLVAQGLSSATVNLRLAPVRRLAREMADNGFLAPEAGAAIQRVPGVARHGIRLGNWLTKEQANDLLNAPDPQTLTGKRDRALLALLVGCGLRRSELVSLYIESLELRDARWVIPDLIGKGGRVRTVTVPAGVKARIDAWTAAAGISFGPLFRPVTKGGKVQGRGLEDQKAVWRMVARYAREAELGRLAPHDLRRTCAKLCRRAGGDSSRSNCCSAMPRCRLPRGISARSRIWSRRSMMDWDWSWDDPAKQRFGGARWLPRSWLGMIRADLWQRARQQPI